MNIFEQIIDLLSSSIGGMTYHLVITFYLLNLWMPINANYREYKSDEDKQLLMGIFGMILIQIGLFFASTYSMAGSPVVSNVLPLLDRWVGFVFSLVVIWLWKVPVKEKKPKVIYLVSFLLSVGALIVSVLSWNITGSDNAFEVSVLNQAWNIGTIFLLLYGLVSFLRTKEEKIPSAIAMMLILLVGESLQTLIYLNSNFPILTRLAQMISFPLLMGVVRPPMEVIEISAKSIGIEEPEIFSQPEEVPVVEIAPEPEPTPIPVIEANNQDDTFNLSPSPENQGIKITPDKFKQTLLMAGELDPELIYAQLAEFISQALVADVCLLFSPPSNENSFFLFSGFDLILEGKINSTMIEYVLNDEMAKVQAEKNPLQIPSADAKIWESLSHRLNVSNIGPALLTPIFTNNSEFIGAIFLISPYSNHQWTDEDEEFLTSNNDEIAMVFERASQSGVKTQSDLEGDMALQSRIDELEKEIYQLTKDSSLAEELSADDTVVSNLETDLEESLQKELNEAKVIMQEQVLEIKSYQSQAVEPGEDTSAIITLQAELDMARVEIGTLKSESIADGHILPIPQLPKAGISEKFTQIAHDIRQPVTSISGFTDLLLSESVGNLGALQKKFLGRVKTSIAKISDMVASLVQITSEQESKFLFKPQIIELMDVIDEVMAKTRKPFQKGNIILRVNMPQILPPMFSHKDALEQLIIHLLQHVQNSTNSGEEIFLNIGEDTVEDKHTIFIDIRGGELIPDKDIELILSSNDLSEKYSDIHYAKDLSELVGGELKISNIEETETTFSVYFPTELAVSEMQAE